jgi:NADPH-dependent 2,4-dienoyl-CoA reductase/sulfur reductase-like enzyme
VLIDEQGRTSLPRVVATGDVAAGYDPLAGGIVRGEHWTSALQHPNVAAAALLGVEPKPQPAHATVPYFWSDQYGIQVQFAGYRRAGDEVEIVDGSLEPDESGSRRFVAVYRRDGLPVAVLGIGIPRTFNTWRRELVKTRDRLTSR